MTRHVLIGVAVVVLNAGNSGRADDKDEWKALGGTWKVEKAVLMGMDATDLFKTVVMELKDGTFTVDFAGQVDKGTVTVDPAQKPKRLTVKTTEGANKDKVFEAIYELKGDTLTVCYALEGKDAPKEFASKEGTMTLLATYKRDKK